MRFYFIAIIILLALIACNSNKTGNAPITKDTLFSAKDPVVGKFSLPYSEQVYADTNNLIFYYTKPFDTSFLIHLRRSKDEIVGTYYHTLPKIHRDLEGYSNSDIRFLFFEGFSFVINTGIWDSLKTSATELLSKDSLVGSKVCLDCPSYFLAYNGKTRYDNKANEVYFKNLSEYLGATIIDKVNNIRQERFENKP